MKFADTIHAIQWAEEMATRSNLQSQIGGIMAVTTGGGNDTLDIALTICARVAACQPVQAGVALKCIYGGRDKARDIYLGEQIGQRLHQTNHGKGKTATQCHALGVSIIKAERALTLFGDKYPLARMARDIGISRKNFTKGIAWIAMRYEGREVLRAWADQGEREMSEWLERMCWLTT